MEEVLSYDNDHINSSVYQIQLTTVNRFIIFHQLKGSYSIFFYFTNCCYTREYTLIQILFCRGLNTPLHRAIFYDHKHTRHERELNPQGFNRADTSLRLFSTTLSSPGMGWSILFNENWNTCACLIIFGIDKLLHFWP